MIKASVQPNGEYTATSTVEFDLGKVYENISEGNITTVVGGAYVKSMIKFYEEMLYNGIKDKKDFEEVLEAYTQFKMLDVAGIEKYPLELKDDELIGVKEGFEIIID